jgi:restriction system protein
MANYPCIDHRSLSLEEWLKYVKTDRSKRKFSILDCQFATDEHFLEYLKNIKDRSDEEVKYLISSFIITDPHLGYDDHLRTWLYQMPPAELDAAILASPFLKRVAFPNKESPPWCSMIWILELLPRHPQEAIQALSAYFSAHCMYMPDARMHGLSDAQALIRAKYIEHDLPVRQTLLDMPSRDFELIVGYLYKKLGYSIEITPRTRDGGYDIVAEKYSEREHERLHIECKRYEGNVGVDVVRKVLGTLNVTNATKAVVVTSASFTKPARDEAYKSKRLELIDIESFDKLMRHNFNVNWIDRISDCLFEMRKLIVASSGEI